MHKMVAGCIVVQVDLGAEAFVVAIDEFAFGRNKIQRIVWFIRFRELMTAAYDNPQFQLAGQFDDLQCLVFE